MAAAHGLQRAGGHPARGAVQPHLGPLSSRPGGAPTRLGARHARLQRPRAAGAGALAGDPDGGAPGQQHGPPQPPQRPEAPYDLKPFPRRRERNPHRLLGVEPEASFEEVQDARNYLYERYKWDDPSREAIEGAFDSLLQTHFKSRKAHGFSPPGLKARGGPRERGAPGPLARLRGLFDPTVTARTLINEGAVFGAFALWVLFSSDPSFPFAGTFVYCVYQFQQKRVRRDPEGPFLFNSALAGAVLSTALCLGAALGATALLAAPLSAVIEQSARQVGSFITIVVVGALGVYLK